MKFVGLALLLGCTALVCKFAMQSDLIHLQPSAVNALPGFLAAMKRFGASFPYPPLPTSSLLAAIPRPAAPKIRLSKSQTLSLIHLAALKHKVPAAFVQSIVAAESNFDCTALSPKGAIGLMQLMPETAHDFGADPNDPAQNVDAGTHYLRFLMDRYQNSRGSLKRVIAAYNAGPGNVDRYRGIPPFRETRQYVVRVLNFLTQFGGSRKHSGALG